jgi:hypothetical protein
VLLLLAFFLLVFSAIFLFLFPAFLPFAVGLLEFDVQIETVKAGAKPFHFIVQLNNFRFSCQSRCAARIGRAFFAAGVRPAALLTYATHMRVRPNSRREKQCAQHWQNVAYDYQPIWRIRSRMSAL